MFLYLFLTLSPIPTELKPNSAKNCSKSTIFDFDPKSRFLGGLPSSLWGLPGAVQLAGRPAYRQARLHACTSACQQATLPNFTRGAPPPHPPKSRLAAYGQPPGPGALGPQGSPGPYRALGAAGLGPWAPEAAGRQPTFGGVRGGRSPPV